MEAENEDGKTNPSDNITAHQSLRSPIGLLKLDIGSPDSDRDAFDAIVPSNSIPTSSPLKSYNVRFLDHEADVIEDGKLMEDKEEKNVIDHEEREDETGYRYQEEKLSEDKKEIDDRFDDKEVIYPSDELNYHDGYDDDLPSHWHRYFDDQYQCYYYVNSETGVTQWEFPEAEKGEDFTREVENTEGHLGTSLYIDEGLENLKRFNERNKKRAKSLSSVSIEWYGSEDFQDYVSDATSPHGRRISAGSASLSPLHRGLYKNEPYDNYEYRGFCNLDRKSSALEAGKTSKTSQDYLQMARLYKIQRPYSDPSHPALCLLCHKNYAEDVFFPCEHHCVCRQCIKTEKICEDRQLHKIKDGYANCSLCAGIIKLILPLDGGKEVEKYWDWVYEEKVQLPSGFMRNFKHSEAVIRAVYMDEKYHGHDSLNTTSTFCAIN